MPIFTTVNDAVQFVDDILQDDQSRDGESHQQVIQRVGRQLWDEGHIDGLRSGDNWTPWLDTIAPDAIARFINRETATITD